MITWRIIKCSTHYLPPFCTTCSIQFITLVMERPMYHTGHGNGRLLQQLFPGRLIYRHSDFSYPSRSTDLSLYDPFLWGTLKEQCFASIPESLDHGRATVAHCVTGRWRNVSHYCRPLRLIYVFCAQISTARCADSTRCTQTVQGGCT